MSRNVTGWVGWVWFAAFSILAVGLFNIVAGVAAAFSPNDVLSWTNNGVAVVDVSTWGWVHIILGALLVAAALALFSGAGWARVVAIILVVLNLIAQFVSLQTTPFWSLVIIVVDLVILWALTVHGDEVERASR
jgi:hypothetical protein